MAEWPEESADIERWREAWMELAPPRADEAGAADDPDETTAEVVRYLRRAWELVEAPPPPRIPVRAVAVPEMRAQREGTRPARALAAAAVLLALLGGGLLFRSFLFPTRPASDRGLQRTSPSGGAEQAHPGSASASPRIASLEPDRLEMRSGPVRLILLTRARSNETQHGAAR